MRRLFRFVVSGASVAELKDNMSKALDELNGEETTTEPCSQVTAPAPRPAPDLPSIPLDVVRAVEHETSAAPHVPQTNLNYGVDSMGLPWDERIHSVSAAKNKDGSWRTRRGVEPAYVKQIEHELIANIKANQSEDEYREQIKQPVTLPQIPAVPVVQTFQGPAVPPAPMIPPFHAPPSIPLGNLTAPAPAAPQPTVPFTVPPSIVTPVAPAPPVQAPVTSAHSLSTFSAQFVPTLSHLVAEGKLTNEYVAALKNYFKLEQIFDANEQQKAEMFETFVAAGLLTKVG